MKNKKELKANKSIIALSLCYAILSIIAYINNAYFIFSVLITVSPAILALNLRSILKRRNKVRFYNVSIKIK